MFKIGAILDGIRTRKDNTLALTIGTQEPTSEQASAIMALRNSYITLTCYGEHEDEPRESEASIREPKVSVGRRSKSKLFRDILFRLWEQSGSALSSEKFYEFEMDKLINHYMKKLD